MISRTVRVGSGGGHESGGHESGEREEEDTRRSTDMASRHVRSVCYCGGGFCVLRTEFMYSVLKSNVVLPRCCDLVLPRW